MPKQEGQKSKLVTLLRILEQRTDENHRLNVPQLVQLLESQGILAERKSIYSDIDTLRSLGFDVQLQRGRGGGYWLASRTFELSELKLLVDAVQASKVISARTSRKLIHKLEALCSDYEGTQLQRQVYVDGRPKTDSQTLLYSIDALHTAINRGCLVQFRYKNNSTWTVSPWQLAWEGGCYYLIAYQDEKEPVGIRHYRVDKMAGVTVLDEPRLTLEDLSWVVCHQANSRIIDHCVRALKADPAKFYKNMDRHGNTSAASIPVALNELAESGQLTPGRPLACIGFGGGLTWGGAILQYKE